MSMRSAAFGVLVLGLALVAGATGAGMQVPDSLVFARHGDIFRITLDGTETVQLTATKAEEFAPAVSPDRSLIAYRRSRHELWLMRPDGTGQRRFFAGRPAMSGVRTGTPSWTPDSRTVYFDRWTEHRFCGSVFSVRIDGRGLERVTDGLLDSSAELDPAVSPDGTRLAISSSAYCEPGWTGELAVIDRSGRPTRDLKRYRGVPGAVLDPTWSPDGRRIAFVSWDHLGLDWSIVYVVNRDGTGLRRLTPKRLEAWTPAWSPNGDWIAFPGAKGIYVLHPDGSGIQKVPGTVEGDGGPTWSPRT